MRIFLDQFCLSDGGEESPQTFTVNGKRQGQIVPLLRGAAAVIFPRGNRVNTVEFAVARRHGSRGAAEAFLLRHAATLPGGGTLTWLCEDGDGNVVRYAAVAVVVVSDQGSLDEDVTTHRYSVVCGEIRGGETR